MRLEAWIDKYDAETPDITRFILPGGGTVSSTLHVCRTVCRRAERLVVTLARTQEINPEVRRYLNRLSDFSSRLPAQLISAKELLMWNIYAVLRCLNVNHELL